MKHKPILCRVCGFRLEDLGEKIEEREIQGRIARFVGDEEVCGCKGTPTRHPFTSRPQPPNLDTYDRRRK
jgi:hypothetical protein